MSGRPMSIAELLHLPTVVDLATAARALGMGRTTAYTLARTDRFPCKLLRVGASYRVPTAALTDLLAIDPRQLTTPASPGRAGQSDPAPPQAPRGRRTGQRRSRHRPRSDPATARPGAHVPARTTREARDGRPNPRARDWHEPPPQREHGRPEPHTRRRRR